MILDRQERLHILRRAFGTIRPSADGLNVACRCPSCRHTVTGDRVKLKLAVHLDSGIYHCWVCGIRGRSISRLIKRFIKDHDLYDVASRLWPNAGSATSSARERASVDDVQLPPEFVMLATVIDDTRYERVIRYVTSRGISIDDMWRWRLGASLNDCFIDRVIIPSFDVCGKLNYYTSRAVDDFTFPRYINAKMMKQDIIFNELDIDWDAELLITEGAFDLFTTHDNAVPLLGNSLNEEFKLFESIVQHDTPVVLALDADAAVHTARIARLLYSFNIDVKVMSLAGYKDLGAMPRHLYRQLRGSAERWTPESELMSRIVKIDVTKSPNFMLNRDQRHDAHMSYC